MRCRRLAAQPRLPERVFNGLRSIPQHRSDEFLFRSLFPFGRAGQQDGDRLRSDELPQRRQQFDRHISQAPTGRAESQVVRERPQPSLLLQSISQILQTGVHVVRLVREFDLLCDQFARRSDQEWSLHEIGIHHRAERNQFTMDYSGQSNPDSQRPIFEVQRARSVLPGTLQRGDHFCAMQRAAFRLHSFRLRDVIGSRVVSSRLVGMCHPELKGSSESGRQRRQQRFASSGTITFDRRGGG